MVFMIADIEVTFGRKWGRGFFFLGESTSGTGSWVRAGKSAEMDRFLKVCLKPEVNNRRKIIHK